MVTFTEAQVMAWITPVFWPFIRVLAMLSVVPVLSNRALPLRVRIALSFLIALVVGPWMADNPGPSLNSPLAFGAVAEQVAIGVVIGFAVRIVFAAVEMAGELVGLQMGLGFAAFFDPGIGGQSNAVSRFFNTNTSLVFLAMNGHLLVIAAVIRSLEVFPVTGQPLSFIAAVQGQFWGVEVFRLGLWIALPMIAMLTFVNIVLGVISRVAPQMNVFAIGFPITLAMGLIGLFLTLPLMEKPLISTLERMLGFLG